ncbi:hypothetical protein KOR42_25220 [Thalassoglobus neptunius]|uniref:Uncharacterized protein n=1 Tax=Thalassoglobus neptunius TaxID=1938619 RepID=A0A5C5X9Y7_9PLAN|nr:hypothetical protein [Thalassoglobus neptunius]TWT59133.1 hypothetical protein KOR42_25220 [Thalassoglobus neptunius]
MVDDPLQSLSKELTVPQKPFLNTLGFLMQFAALTFLPLLILWQLNFGFRLIWMPALTTAGVIVFYVGHRLRENDE